MADLQQVIEQSRAVAAGQRIADRLVSLADPEARPIKKGKWGRPVPLGYQVPMIEAEDGFVTDDPVEQGHPAGYGHFAL